MRENILEFPDRQAIAEEAGAWLIKLDGDSAPSAEELASLREWLSRSALHREHLANLAEFWGKMNVLTELAVPLGRQEAGANRGNANRRRYAVPRAARFGFVAAAVIAGIAVVSTFWLRPDPFLSSNGLYATAVGQQQSTVLADGSVVLSNTNTQIRVHYNDEYRDIRLLQGEAHFTVAKNAARPFRVYAGTGRVQALGTAFSVYLKDNTIDVTVTEGKVALASVNRGSGDPIPQQAIPPRDVRSPGSNEIVDSGLVEAWGTIEAGESATIRSAPDAETPSVVDAIETVEAKEMAKRLSWRDGMLTFSGDPLHAVVDEITRYTTVTIEISDPAVRARRVGGQFPIGETDVMFDYLEANFALRVTRLSHDRVLVSAAEE